MDPRNFQPKHRSEKVLVPFKTAEQVGFVPFTLHKPLLTTDPCREKESRVSGHCRNKSLRSKGSSRPSQPTACVLYRRGSKTPARSSCAKAVRLPAQDSHKHAGHGRQASSRCRPGPAAPCAVLATGAHTARSRVTSGSSSSSASRRRRCCHHQARPGARFPPRTCRPRCLPSQRQPRPEGRAPKGHAGSAPWPPSASSRRRTCSERLPGLPGLRAEPARERLPPPPAARASHQR